MTQRVERRTAIHTLEDHYKCLCEPTLSQQRMTQRVERSMVFWTLEELLATSNLLSDHAGSGDHGEATVVELFGLHLIQLLRILWPDARGSKPKSPGLRSVRIDHGSLPAGLWKLKTEKMSGMAIAATTAGQKVCKGVAWNAT